MIAFKYFGTVKLAIFCMRFIKNLVSEWLPIKEFFRPPFQSLETLEYVKWNTFCLRFQFGPFRVHLLVCDLCSRLQQGRCNKQCIGCLRYCPQKACYFCKEKIYSILDRYMYKLRRSKFTCIHSLLWNEICLVTY